MVQNGSFESGVSPWKVQVNSPAAASSTQDSTTAESGTYSEKVVVTTVGKDWYVQLKQWGMAITAGHTYTVSFWAKASSSRTDDFVIQQQGSPYTIYTERPMSLTTSWQHITATVTPTASNNNVFIGFNVGQTVGTVWVDNVSVTS
jgi:hypothetical protein